MKEAAKFTREAPVTKVHIHNCFFDKTRYVPRAVVEAKKQIGLNAPKYLVKNDYMRESMVKGVDTYTLTAAGEEWLRKGLLRHLELHPEDIAECKELPAGVSRPKAKPRVKVTEPEKIVPKFTGKPTIRRTRG